MADPARAFLNELREDEKERVQRLTRILEIDPFIDGRSKIRVDLGGVAESVYLHPEYWLFYRMADNAFLVIDARAWFDPSWSPPDLPPNLRL